jgi:energy-coupling factor transporter transmembrane protein EcfT
VKILIIIPVIIIIVIIIIINIIIAIVTIITKIVIVAIVIIEVVVVVGLIIVLLIIVIVICLLVVFLPGLHNESGLLGRPAAATAVVVLSQDDPTASAAPDVTVGASKPQRLGSPGHSVHAVVYMPCAQMA